MAKRIKIKGKVPRGLSKSDRRAYADAVKHDDYDLKLSTDMSPKNVSSTPSSTLKKRVKEGNRKFVGPRQYSNELKENRGRRNDNWTKEPGGRSYLRELSRELLERDDPTVNAYESGVGKIRGGLSDKVVAKLKAAVRKIALKPENEMTDRERKFIRTIDSTGHFLGNYR